MAAAAIAAKTAPMTSATNLGELGGPTAVQLGHLDVDPAALTGGGAGLWQVIGTGRNLDVRVPREFLDVLPESGWRLVHANPAGVKRGRSEMLAAPYSPAAGGWAVVNLAERDGKWIVSCNPGPLQVYPSRADRRARLSLSWASELTALASSLPELTVLLSNTSSSTWRNVADDGQFIAAFLYEEGSPREGLRYVSTAHRRLDDLEPGQSVELPVAFQPAASQLYAPGRYDIDARLIDLDLRCPDAVITLR